MAMSRVSVFLSAFAAAVTAEICSEQESPWTSVQEYIDYCAVRPQAFSIPAPCCSPPWEQLRIILAENIPQWWQTSRQQSMVRLRFVVALENVRLHGLCADFGSDCPFATFSTQAFRLLATNGDMSSLDEEGVQEHFETVEEKSRKVFGCIARCEEKFKKSVL